MSSSADPTALLQEERDYFAANQAEWQLAFPGKFALVKGRQLISAFDRADDAVAAGLQKFEKGPFLVRSVEQAEQDLFIPALVFGLLSKAA